MSELKGKVVLLVIVLSVAGLLAIVSQSSSSATVPDQIFTSTVTLGSSLVTSLSQTQQVVNTTFTVLSTTGTSLQCELWSYNFTATVGQYISGGYSSDNAVSFFLVQQTSSQGWITANPCGSATNTLASQLDSTGFSFGPLAIPTSGTWTIIIVNSSNAKNAEGVVAVYLGSAPQTMTQPLMTTITTTLPPSLTQAQTSTSEQTTFSGPTTTIPGFSFTSIVVGMIGGLVAILMLKKRNEHR